MPSKIAYWLRSLVKKSSKSSKLLAQKIVSKLPYQQKQNAKDEWKKANQPTVESHDVVMEKLHEEDQHSKEPCTSKRSTLMTACHSGDTEKVKSLLEDNVDINEQDEKGTTALILACLRGHTEIVEMLLKKGALVDTQSEWNKTALMLASQKGHVEVVRLLLEHNARVDLQDYQGWTALMLASRNGHNYVANLLLQQGAKVDLHTEAGTALMWASEEGHEEVAKLLLDHGAQVNLSSKIGETALMWACDAGHTGVAKLLLDYGAQVNLCTKWSEETALLRASKKGHSDVVKLLLEHCAQADLQTEKGKTALMCASEEGHYEVARLLLEHGAQVDLQNSEGETALILASSLGQNEVVKLLVEHGAQVSIKDGYECSVLMRACHQGHAKVIKVLLAKGCIVQINEPDSRGETALMYASNKGHLQVAKILLHHGAQADLQNINRRTALMQASSNGHTEVVKLLLEHGAKITLQDKYGWSVLMHACCQSQTELIHLLLEQGCGVQINQPDSFGKTALMCASEKGHYKVAELLLEKGAQIDLRDKKGKTALMHASRGGHYDVAKLLLQHQACVNLQANKGKTALMFAAKKGHYEVAKLLLTSDAEVDLKAKQGNSKERFDGITALWLSMKYKEVAKMLIEHGAKVNMHAVAQLEHDSSQVKIMIERLTFLSWLVFSEYISQDYIKFILEHGAKVDAKTKLICTYRKSSELESLECGAEVNRQTIIDGITALMCAASLRCESYVFELLLECGAQIDSKTTGDIDGLTPLMFAAIFGREEVANVLLKHGAEVNLHANFSMNIVFLDEDIYDAVKVLLPEHRSLADLQMKDEFEGITALMCAIVFGNNDVAKLLLKHGAQVNIQAKGVMKGKTALILALIKGQYKAVELLLKHGAEVDLQDSNGRSPLMYAVQTEYTDTVELFIALGANVDLQDDHGWSPLMYAVQAENLKAVELLITHGANIHLKTFEGKALHDLCSPDLKEDPDYIEALLRTDKNLEMDSRFPGITFFGQRFKEILTSREATIGQLCDGVSVYVPTNALSSEVESAKLSIRPCFNGPFEFPAEYKPVSPAYLIRHSKAHFQKDITIRMHHYANLQSEKDCEDMAFLTASSTPEYRGEQPVYVFKKIHGAMGVFKPGDQVGEISLQHFCSLIIGKRKRQSNSENSPESPESSSKRHHGDLYYSARLYRGANHDGAVSTAVFCMCLYHPIYIKHCDAMITKNYAGEKSADFVQVHGDSIVINSNDPSGEHVKFDKVPAQILRREVHLPEILNIDVGELLEYPPRLSISVKTSQDFTSPVLKVHGLDKECGYSLLPISTSSIAPPVRSSSETVQRTRIWNYPTQGPQSPGNQFMYASSSMPQFPQQNAPPSMESSSSAVPMAPGFWNYPTPALFQGPQPPGSQFAERLSSQQNAPFITPPVGSSSSVVQMAPQTWNYPTPAPLQGSQPPVNQSAEKLHAPSTTPQSFQQKDACTVDFMLDADSSTLDIDDLSDVLDEVKTLSSKWRLLLTKLGVKQSTLDTVKTDNFGDAKMCLYEALGEWLRLNYDHQRHGRPSWRRLVKAVSDIDFALSETLSKKH